jgi:hypothetical protein
MPYCTARRKGERLVAQQNRLQGDLAEKKKALMEAKSALSTSRANKTKLEVPTLASIEVLFEKYNISPAAYHGGKLNKVDCREVMGKASELFCLKCNTMTGLLLRSLKLFQKFGIYASL